MDGEDLELFERSLRYATDNHTGAELDGALEELGWLDALADDPEAAISLLFALQGETNTTSSAVDFVLHHGLGTDPTVGMVLPAHGRWAPPAQRRDGVVQIRGLGTAALAHHATALVVTATAEKHLAVTVASTDLTLRAIEGVDPTFGLVEVAGDAAATDLTPVDWSAALRLGHLALGHELVGASRKMLELAREHALERVQFGKPIAAFQAIRHRLAETLVAIEMADALLDAAWLDRSAQAAAMGKAAAGRAARTASRHCQQVLAGIGFTTEHPLHLYIKRVLVLDQLLGSYRSLTNQLGTEVLQSRQLPPLLPL